MDSYFAGKTAVVTGGSGALGRYFCKALADAGAKVAVVGSRMETATVVADEIVRDGGIAVPFACDVQEPQSVAALREAVNEALGHAHILVNAAGIAPASACTQKEQAAQGDAALPLGEERTLFNIPSEVFRNVMDLNCLGIFHTVQVFAPDMAEEEGASILNISSMSAISPLTKQVAYSASKAAVSNLTQWLAMYLADLGIRVNAIAPGFF